MRLIDADELGYECKISPSGYLYVTDDDIINATTIDAVPVVWCADCRHFRCNLRPDGYLPEGVEETECTLFHVGMDYIDFCSHGERRNKENMN